MGDCMHIHYYLWESRIKSMIVRLYPYARQKQNNDLQHKTPKQEKSKRERKRKREREREKSQHKNIRRVRFAHLFLLELYYALREPEEKPVSGHVAGEQELPAAAHARLFAPEMLHVDAEM
jgi:hypothetical protein